MGKSLHILWRKNCIYVGDNIAMIINLEYHGIAKKTPIPNSVRGKGYAPPPTDDC